MIEAITSPWIISYITIGIFIAAYMSTMLYLDAGVTKCQTLFTIVACLSAWPVLMIIFTIDYIEDHLT